MKNIDILCMTSETMLPVLDALINVKGVVAVLLVRKDGAVVGSQSRANVDVDSLGTMIATAIGASETLASEFSLGEFSLLQCEYEQGKTLLLTFDDYVVSVFVDETAVIASVKYRLKESLADRFK